MKEPVSIVVADDHPVVLHGLVALLAGKTDFRVVAACADGEEAFEAISAKDPDIALLDFRMPKLSGLEVLAKLASAELRTRIVFLTASANDAHVLAAITRSAYGVVLKDSVADTIVACLREVAVGRRWISDELLEKAPGSSGGAMPQMAPALRALSLRERDVLRLLADGLSNKEIARSLGTTEGTVKVHVHKIYEKIGVNNRTSLAALVWRFGDD